MIEEYISRFAAAHGCIAGICDALPLEEARARLLAVSTPFVSRHIEKRINPSLSLPGAKSVIALGKGYVPSFFCNLSSLGYGTDYHITLKNSLEALAKPLDCQSAIMVDSGPLAERAFAVKAGLGFWGKNGMVISPVLGSFFNIGLLIVDIALTPSKITQPNTCPEDCRRCIEACPNEAIKPYSVNPALCASYITQKKGPLTDAETALMGTQLYGCDLCQICCPMNKTSAPSAYEDPANILCMEADDFENRFGHTSMAWRGLKHLQRNARVQMTKKGDYNGTLEYTGPAGQRL